MKTLRWGGAAFAAIVAAHGAGTAFGQTITGDVDGNHEVSLSDVTGFVGCLSGPGTPSLDSLCGAARFDQDDDVDLRDVSGFQSRFGFGVGPPRIDRFWPSPGEWIVDDLGLTEVRVGFSEPVIVPDDSIDVWVVSRLQVDGGDVAGFTTLYDPNDFMLTVTFAEPLRDDRVTVVVDYLIEDLAGNPLDGEIYNPHNAALPSGNGVNGGQGVFRIHVLQGDANRDGIVDDSDAALLDASLGFCEGDPGFDPLADLNSDDCVDDQDAAITTASMGQQLPTTDGKAPVVLGLFEPAAGQDEFNVVEVDFNEVVSDSQVAKLTCFLVDEHGNVRAPEFAVGGPFGTSAVYFFGAEMLNCSQYTINITNAIADFSGELLASPQEFTCP